MRQEELTDWLTRVEKKLDDHLLRTAKSDAEVSGLKVQVKWMGAVVLGILGKLLHTSFLSK